MSNQSDDSSFNTSSWDEAVIRRMDESIVASLDSMGSMITIGEGFSWGKMDGMITTVDRMINCELTT